MRFLKSIFLAAFFLLSVLVAAAAPGDPDPTFGAVGFATTSLSLGYDSGTAVLRQPDGKFIVVGTQGNSGTARIALVRYNPNGTLDATFDGDGMVVVNAVAGSAVGIAGALQADGKIVVAGSIPNAFNTSYLVLRFNPNGTLDASFDGDGIYNDPNLARPSAIAVQADGKIVTAGTLYTFNGNGSDFLVVRHNADGSPDQTFDGDGKAMISIATGTSNGSDYAFALALQPDGRIVVGGYSDFSFTSRDFTLARLNADGSLDATFDGDGKVQTTISNYQDAINSLAIQADGKIIAAGFATPNFIGGNFALVRYNADGSLDQTFDADGIVITSGGVGEIRKIAVQPDGKIVAVGTNALGNNILQFAVFRYNSNGSLDAEFSGDGKAFTLIYEAGQAKPNDLVIEPDGKITVVGDGQPGGGNFDGNIVFARYNADGTPSTALGIFGRISTHVLNSRSEANDVALQPDGKIIVGGSRAVSSEYTMGTIARYTAEGRLDTTFSGSGANDGFASTAFNNVISSEVNSVAVQPDGKIIAAGFYETDADAGLLIVRLNSNGSRDTSFGSGGATLIGASAGGGIGLEIALQPDGTIVVAGAAINLATQTTDFAVYRFNQNGSHLSTAATSLGAGNDIAFSAAIQPDGKIVVAGAQNVDENSIANSDIVLMRLTVEGRPDASFGTNGIVTTALGNFADIASEVRVQPDGKIVVSGVSCTSSGCETGVVALLRYNADGSLDQTFDADGVVLTQIPGSSASSASSLAIQSNGKIVVAGETIRPGTRSDAFVARYETNGALDSTFAAGGIAVSDIGGSNQAANAVILQPDGKIVVAGTSETTTPPPFAGVRKDFTVWGYSGDAPRAARRTQFDFDGDGKADISVFRSSNAAWYLLRSISGFTAAQFGVSTDKIAPADFDADGKTDIAVFRDGFWYWLNSSNNSFNAVQFGSPGDVPVPTDYNGDGRAEIAVFRAGNWYFLNLTNNQFTAVQFGVAGDKPVQADYDADGKIDVAVFRSGVWYYLQSSNNQFQALPFGLPADKPVVGDYDADGKADAAVFRDGIWYLQRTAQGFTGLQFGISTDIPVPADYDGDGKTDIAVFRNGYWYSLNSSNGQFVAVQFGIDADKPVPSAFVP